MCSSARYSFSLLPVNASIGGLAASIDPKSLHLTRPVSSRCRFLRPREPPGCLTGPTERWERDARVSDRPDHGSREYLPTEQIRRRRDIPWFDLVVIFPMT